MRAIKQPIFSATQRVSAQEEVGLCGFRPSYFQSTGASLRELRSLSRSKKKLRYHLFKNKNQVTETYFYSPNRAELHRPYASHLQLLPLGLTEHKLSLKTAAEEKPPPKKTQRREAEPEERQPDRKQKREFKLIHQIKREKANKAKLKQAEQEQSSIYQRTGQIETLPNKKIDIFTEELHDILHSPQPTSPKPSAMSPNPNPNPNPKSKMGSNIDDFDPRLDLHEPSEFLPEQIKQQPVAVPAMEESYRQPDLNRSCLKAQQILRQRRDSASSMDMSVRVSKIREEMSLSLALESINNSRAKEYSLLKGMEAKGKGKASSGEGGTGERLRTHLSILQTLSQFVFQSTRFDVVTEEWEELNFLIYKKYYIERRKVVHFISKYPMRNPFNVYNAEISSKEVIDFMKSDQGERFKEETTKETAQVRARLASFYSHFDKAKVGEKINLFEYDNFSHWIIEELWAELILTEYNASHEREAIQHRMCRILQLIFLISELNGKYEFPFEEAEHAIATKHYQQYIQEGKDIFEKYILYKSP